MTLRSLTPLFALLVAAAACKPAAKYHCNMATGDESRACQVIEASSVSEAQEYCQANDSTGRACCCSETTEEVASAGSCASCNGSGSGGGGTGSSCFGPDGSEYADGDYRCATGNGSSQIDRCQSGTWVQADTCTCTTASGYWGSCKIYSGGKVDCSYAFEACMVCEPGVGCH